MRRIDSCLIDLCLHENLLLCEDIILTESFYYTSNIIAIFRREEYSSIKNNKDKTRL